MSRLQVHSKSYKKLEKPLIIYMSGSNVSNDQFHRVMSALKEIQLLRIVVRKDKKKDSFKYVLSNSSFWLSLADNPSKYNFSVIWMDTDSRALNRYNKPGTDWFIIEPAGGINIIYANTLYSVATGAISPEDSWNMDEDEYDTLVELMKHHYDSDFEIEHREKMGRKFEANVFIPFKNYTEKERKVEEDKAGDNEGISFFKCEYLEQKGRGSSYVFYSNDPDANPEKTILSVGNKITLFSCDGKACQTGQIFDIDYDSDESVKFSVDFLFQTNHDEIPAEGKMVMAYNDTQDRVREKVIRGIESGTVPSKYMYKTFEKFEGGAYFAPDYKDEPEIASEQGYLPADLPDYLTKLMAEKKDNGKPNFPPNDMQMEAIIKGILTKDMLLVLGPPGTGKTTVILAWVNYFVNKGMRVLISSQNNAAVDNVLERLATGINVVRLGQETKIQSNCRHFMPMHKQAEMSKNCKENNERIQNDVVSDLESIETRRKTLDEFLEFIRCYNIKKQEFEADKRRIIEAMQKISVLDESINTCEKRIESLVDQRAHKRIFLEESKKKNFIVRFFIKRHVKRVTEELKETEKALKTAMTVYQLGIINYNKAVEELKNITETARAKDSYSAYMVAARELSIFTETFIVSEDEEKNPIYHGRLDLKGELSHIYTPFDYTFDNNQNEKIANAEKVHLESLKSSAAMLVKAINDWAGAIQRGGNEIFEEILLSSCQVVGATCIGINSNKKFANVDFDVAIVDESGQIQIHNAMVPLSRAPKVLMLGDYKQIPPCANDDVVAACEQEEIDVSLLKMSFFEFLFEKMRETEVKRLVKEKRLKLKDEKKKEFVEDFDLDAVEIDEDETERLTSEAKAHTLAPVLKNYSIKGYRALATDGEKRQYLKNLASALLADPKKIVNLNSQFRMPGHISEVISEWFYENNYKSSYDISKFVPMLPNTTKPMVVINTANNSSRFESQPSNKMGYMNNYEAGLVADIVEQVIAALPDEERARMLEKPAENIGIISAYGAQVRTMRETLRKRGLGISNDQVNGMVASLDSFQGQERDLIIYSLTRSKRGGDPARARVGFMKELRRLNVAFTRSKKQLVMVGDIDYLKECLYMKMDIDNPINVPCAKEIDGFISEAQINQCAECPVAECERKFARFIRLLMQHVENPETAAGDLIPSENLVKVLKGEIEQ